MGSWRLAQWQRDPGPGVPRSARRTGEYRSYVPDRLVGQAIIPTRESDAALASAERAVRSLQGGAGAQDLAGIARFLLRSEAIASSRIEGVAPGARQIALAELARDEELTGFSEQADFVARNMTVVQRASDALADSATLTTDDIIALHSALLPEGQLGFRQVPNWVGGSAWHPLDAEFVPPPPELVPELMTDLVEYLMGAGHSALVQAALAHAQFETIHPFTDGNGRVGRALIHTVLVRRGLTPTALLPVSMVLATFSDEYVAGLTAYRHAAEPGSQAALDGVNDWLLTFSRAVSRAAEQAEVLRTQLAALREDWAERLQLHRDAEGRRRGLRSDSATGQILARLPATPLLTARTVERVHGVSGAAASKALGELQGAGILTQRSGRVKVYSADEVLDLITLSERRLASTRFDTRAAAPRRPVPANPGQPSPSDQV